MKMYINSVPYSGLTNLVVEFDNTYIGCFSDSMKDMLSNENLKKHLSNDEYKSLNMCDDQVSLHIMHLNTHILDITEIETTLVINSICLENCGISIFNYGLAKELSLRSCSIEAVNFQHCIKDVLLVYTDIESLNSTYGLKSLSLDSSSKIHTAIVPYINDLWITKGIGFNITQLYSFLVTSRNQSTIEMYSKLSLLKIRDSHKSIGMIDYTVMVYVSPMVI